MLTTHMRRDLPALALVMIALLPDGAAAQGGLLGRVKRRVEENVGRQAERRLSAHLRPNPGR